MKRRGRRWFDVIMYENGKQLPPAGSATGAAPGVDPGVKSLATVNDRRVFANPELLRRNIRRRRVDQAIARSKKVHGKRNHSNRRQKFYTRRRALHESINDIQRNNHR